MTTPDAPADNTASEQTHPPVAPSRWRLVGQLTRFGLSSGGSLLAILSLTALLHHIAGWPSEWAYGVTLIVVFVANFLVLRYWVYSDVESDGRLFTQFVQVAICSAIFRGLEYLGFLGLHTKLAWPWVAAVLTVSIISFVVKFFVYRQVIFGKRGASGAQV